MLLFPILLKCSCMFTVYNRRTTTTMMLA